MLPNHRPAAVWVDPMFKVNVRDLPEDGSNSPKGKFGSFSKSVSEALGRDPLSTDLLQRYPFDVEILRLAPGQVPYPYHSHGAQWEFYVVMSGECTVRDGQDNRRTVRQGDAFVFKPGEAHQFFNESAADVTILVVADNPLGETCHYPDSAKWLVRSPERWILRSGDLNYYDGEE